MVSDIIVSVGKLAALILECNREGGHLTKDAVEGRCVHIVLLYALVSIWVT